MSAHLKIALSIVPFALVCLLAIETVHQLAKQRIDEQQQLALQKKLVEVFPLGKGQRLQAIKLELEANPNLPLLPSQQSTRYANAWLVCRHNKKRGMILSLRSAEGYSSYIDLLLGLDNTHKIIGVSILNHQETPGLGDKIEKHKSDWILQFIGHSADSSSWQVKSQTNTSQKHGFDALSAATITSQAIINTLRTTLQDPIKLTDTQHCQ